MSVFAIGNALAVGAIFSLIALGSFLAFRILRFPDLTCDGAYSLGACSAAVLTATTAGRAFALPAAFVVGAAAGLATALMYTRLRFPPIVAGILVVAASYSVNLFQMGAPNRPIEVENTIFASLDRWVAAGDGVAAKMAYRYAVYPACLLAVSAFAFLVIWRLLVSEIGLRVRCVGAHTRLAPRLGINVERSTLVTLALANGTIGLAGGLFSQYQRFADVNMGTGIVMGALASVFLGQAFEGLGRTKPIGLARQLTGVFAGALLYRLLVSFAYDLGLPTSAYNLLTATLVFVALLFPRIRTTWVEAFQRK